MLIKYFWVTATKDVPFTSPHDTCPNLFKLHKEVC